MIFSVSFLYFFFWHVSLSENWHRSICCVKKVINIQNRSLCGIKIGICGKPVMWLVNKMFMIGDINLPKSLEKSGIICIFAIVER